MTPRHHVRCPRCGDWTDPRLSWRAGELTRALCPECAWVIELPDPTGALFKALGPREAPKPPEETAVTRVQGGLFDEIR